VLLTYDQVVNDYELPATEGKRGDPRWPAFARRYGFDIARPAQWKVEALEPDELRRLVLTAVDPYNDRQVLAQQTARQEEQRRALASFVRGWGAAGGTSALRCTGAWAAWAKCMTIPLAPVATSSMSS
jgi:hypothetical protein